MKIEFQDCLAVVTGASSGIGLLSGRLPTGLVRSAFGELDFVADVVLA